MKDTLHQILNTQDENTQHCFQYKMMKINRNVGLPIMILLGKQAPAPAASLFSERSVIYYTYVDYNASVLL